MTGKVTKLALTSRIIVLVLQCMANILIKDHETDVFRSVIDNSQLKITWMDKLINGCLGGLRHWDGEYFLHIAEHGYTYENTLAFYPLYPLIVGLFGRLLHQLTGHYLNLRSCCLLMAVAINLLLFTKAANLLYQLTLRIFNDICKSWHAVLLFCFNPASIFFTAAYSETAFTVVTFYIMIECVTEIRLSRSILMLAFSFLSRSNGLVNIGFPIYFLVRRTVSNMNQIFINIIKIVIIIVSSLIPLTIYNFFTYQLYCNPFNLNVNHTEAIVKYARQKNFVLSGHRLHTQHSPWCDATLPFPYAYVQSHYWHVGFLKYYKLKQLPNFILALPILTFLLWHCSIYLKQFFINFFKGHPSSWRQILKEYKILPFVAHNLFLTIVCICFSHIQISTRLLCSASPCLYWFAADYLPKNFHKLCLRSRGSLILIWFVTYYLVGCILFTNNMPWT